MNTRTMCAGGRHLELEDIPGPNDTVDRTVITSASACDCPATCSDCSRPLTQPDEHTSGLCLRCLNGPLPMIRTRHRIAWWIGGILVRTAHLLGLDAQLQRLARRIVAKYGPSKGVTELAASEMTHRESRQADPHPYTPACLRGECRTAGQTHDQVFRR